MSKYVFHSQLKWIFGEDVVIKDKNRHFNSNLNYHRRLLQFFIVREMRKEYAITIRLPRTINFNINEFWYKLNSNEEGGFSNIYQWFHIKS